MRKNVEAIKAMEEKCIAENIKNSYTEVYNYRKLHSSETPEIPALKGAVSNWSLEKTYTENGTSPVTAYIVTNLKANVSLRIIYTEDTLRISSTDVAILLGYKYRTERQNPRWYSMRRTFEKVKYPLKVTENMFIPLKYVSDAAYLAREENAPKICMWLEADVLPWLRERN